MEVSCTLYIVLEMSPVHSLTGHSPQEEALRAGDSLVEGAPKVRSAGGSITAAAVPPLLHERLAPLLDSPEHVTVLPVSTELENVPAST